VGKGKGAKRPPGVANGRFVVGELHRALTGRRSESLNLQSSLKKLGKALEESYTGTLPIGGRVRGTR